MLKVLKWIGIVLGGLIGLILLIAIGLYAKSRIEFTRKYDVKVESISVPTDAASIERGKHLATFLCEECHGDDLGGNTAWFELGPLASAKTPNLTSGKFGIAAQFTDSDWVRVLRHGVKPDGTSVFIMPANDFYYLSDSDLADVVAYVKSVTPVDRGDNNPDIRFTFPGGVMYGAGMFGNLLRASTLDQVNRPSAPEPSVSSQYGEYLVNINGCRDCHGAQLSGGRPGDPSSPLAPNLTPGGEFSAWTQADFIKTLRTGIAPSGLQLPNQFMPWKYKSQMMDDELQAVWLYLHSLPPLTTSTAPSG
jgi:mono/diheme cytochrome c family protein